MRLSSKNKNFTENKKTLVTIRLPLMRNGPENRTKNVKYFSTQGIILLGFPLAMIFRFDA